MCGGLELVERGDDAEPTLRETADPDAVLTLDLKLASRSKDPQHVFIEAPVVDAPECRASQTQAIQGAFASASGGPRLGSTASSRSAARSPSARAWVIGSTPATSSSSSCAT